MPLACRKGRWASSRSRGRHPIPGVSAVTTIADAPAACARSTSERATSSSAGQYSWNHHCPDPQLTRRGDDPALGVGMHQAQHPDRCGEYGRSQRRAQDGGLQVPALGCRGAPPHPGDDVVAGEGSDVGGGSPFGGRGAGDVIEGLRTQLLAGGGLEPGGRHRQRRAAATEPGEVDLVLQVAEVAHPGSLLAHGLLATPGRSLRPRRRDAATLTQTPGAPQRFRPGRLALCMPSR